MTDQERYESKIKLLKQLKLIRDELENLLSINRKFILTIEHNVTSHTLLD